MGVSKVIYNGDTLIDLTADTVTADKLLSGYTAHGADGEEIIGTATSGGGGGDTEPDHWVRPDGWPNYDNVRFSGTDELYMTYDTTDPEYSFIGLGNTGSTGNTINVEIGTITNGVFTAIDTDSYAKASGYYRYLYGAGYPDYVVVRITPQSGKVIQTLPPRQRNATDTVRSNAEFQKCLEIYAHLHNLGQEANPGFRYMYNVRAVYLDIKTASNGISRTLSDLPNLESAHIVSTNSMYIYYLFNNDRKLKYVTLDFAVSGNCSGAFGNCISLESINNTSTWGNMSGATNVSSMFSNCSSLKNIDTSRWVLSSVTDASSMFNECGALETLDTSKWDLSSVTNASKMFNGCRVLETIDTSEWDLSSLTNASSIFAGCRALKTLDASEWDLSSVTDASYIFDGCWALENLVDTSEWDLSSASTTRAMFNECYRLTDLDTSEWDMTNVTDVRNMFGGCYFLTLNKASIDGLGISSKVTTVGGMFYNCKSMRDLDLSLWDLSGIKAVGDSASLFRYMDNINTVTLPSSLAYIGGAFLGDATILKELHLLRTTPPALAASSAIGGPSDRLIYVPYSADHSILNAYKTATNWSSLAKYIVEEDAP